MKRLAAHWQILAALLLATVTALALRGLFANAPETSTAAHFISGALETTKFIGELFMRALKMIIVPLIVTSVVAGIASLQGVSGFGRLGAKTVAFYVGSSLCAILIGLFLVNAIRPGLDHGKPNETVRKAFENSAANASEAERAKIAEAGSREAKDFLDVFRSMLPENVLSAAADNGKLLGVIVFSILFALAITRLPGDEIATIQNFFKSANDAMIVLTNWVMAVAPIGVYALIFPVVYETGAGLFLNLGKYFITVLCALAIHLFVVLPLVLRYAAGINPWNHIKAMRPALLLAFSTASSSGTLPVTMRCVQEGAGVSKRVSSFTLPLGATVNMDGTALYECVAVIFVSQVMGIHLGFGAQFFVVVAALLTSIGVAGIPSASLVAILLVLKNSGIPGADTAVVALLAVDRILDMSRTAVNVFSDSCAAVIVASTEGEALFTEENQVLPEA
ncbi:dicarboxylate/amino acid:cation symporter [Luteolibacter pohnpeiensis]|uniref:Dicarboxylate/amino acid:cation symporter n=1 Tax=Luteolibacter pohnpeiensis TaxID=454153 RepID=A0A934S8K4_9BACT|nr:dicarboxylate/amino acid:cation symporter [Luteolibacter pohnpeiensis]MBK1881349.1 dicarboxylate/amino acid:cation symporter [Luteolibacter pohnpeiensis]